MARAPKKLPPDVVDALFRVKKALGGWDGDADAVDDTEWADITLTPSDYRALCGVIEKYGI